MALSLYTAFPTRGSPPAPSSLRRSGVSAHSFPAIFGNFHPFMRPNNTLARTLGHLKGKLRFPQEKVRTGIRKMMILFQPVNVYLAVHGIIVLIILHEFFAGSLENSRVLSYQN